MADYTSIKNIIQEVVRTNDLHEITGANLQMVLLGMINAVDSNNEDDYTSIRQSINTLAQYVDSADNTIRSSIANLLNYVNAQDNDIRSEINSLANSLNSAKFGYNVSVFGLVAGVHTLATAVKNVPSEYRFGGQKITFKTDAGWVTYQNTSLTIGDYEDVDNWVLDSGTTVEGDVTITNNPDYEDLTQNEGGQLKFADKEYNAASFTGLGRIYLRKNIVNGVNTLTQAMMSDANTIYIIQYDYTLGEDITVPANCVLKFDGGSVSNGNIIGNNTMIIGSPGAFSMTIEMSGTFIADIAKSEWFSIVSDCVLDNELKYLSGTNNYQGFRNLFLFRNIELAHGAYYVKYDDRIYPLEGTTFNGNGATIKCEFEEEYVSFLKITNDNISLNNVNLIGYREYEASSVNYDHSHGIEICGNVIKLSNIITKNFRGDGLYVGPSSAGNAIPSNIIITNCVSDYNYRQGLSITGGRNIDITNSMSTNTSGTAPESGIDIEPNEASDICEQISIFNCLVEGNGTSGILIQGKLDDEKFNTKDIIVENCTLDKNIALGICENVFLKNNLIKKRSLYLINTIKRNIVIQDNIFDGLDYSSKQSTPYSMFVVESSGSNHSDNVVFSGNILSYCGGYAIQVADGVKCNNFTLQDNVILNSKNSIFIGNSATSVTYKNNRTINHGQDYNGDSYGFGWRYYKGDDINTRTDLDIGLHGENVTEGTKQIGIPMFNAAYYRPMWLINGQYVDGRGYKIDFTNGSTSNRPTIDDNTNKGYLYYDTTIFKPIWWRSTRWEEADGCKAGVKRSGTFSEKPYDFDCYIGFSYFCTDRKIDMDSSSPTYLQVITPTSPDTGGMPIFQKGNNVWVDALGRVVS